MGGGFFQQLKILCWRNFLLKWRKGKELAQEIISPIFFILILAILRLVIVPETKDSTGSFPSYSLLRSDFIVDQTKEILVMPNSTETIEFMNKVLVVLNQNGTNHRYKTFSTNEDLETYYKENPTQVSSVLRVDSLVAQNVSITIRMPFGTIPNEYSVSTTTTAAKCRKTDDGLAKTDCPANEFLYSGFATLQLAASTAAIQILKSPNFTMPDIQVEMLPKVAYKPNSDFLQILSAIYYVLAFSPLINFLTIALVTEKEKKTRETMKIMGLRDSVFWLSWASVYSVIVIIVCVAAILLTLAMGFLKHSNFFLFFMLLLLYGLSIISLSFLFTPFFSKARTAGGLASFATLLVSALYLVVPLTRDAATGLSTVPAWGQWLLCLLSPLAFSLGIDQALLLDITGTGMTFETVTQGQFPIYASMVMLLVDTILYALLAAYLDNVIPQEYGQMKPPYFFLQKSYWFPKEAKPMTSGDEDINAENQDVETVPSELKDKKVIRTLLNDIDCKTCMWTNNLFHTIKERRLSVDNGVSIYTEASHPQLRETVIHRIQNLSKRYRSKKGLVHAVTDLSLDIYEGQITCLLGHNGAGKTTLINMLTGMGSPTKGRASIYGLDITNPGDMANLRKMFGMCPQQNILFDNLTSEENLRVFANIKGIPSDQVDKEIDNVLDQVSLSDKKKAYAEKLSGGQKRKLCVAMALVGDPKVLFLDEPTSGLDPYSRRHLWSLLKDKRKGRVIVLTTHFMDEADILSDRKAVINKGKLKCCGSSLFLKSRFGVGYHLDMVVEPSCNREEITLAVRSKIPGAGEGRSHAQELSFTLPLEDAGKFPELFKMLGSPEGGPQTHRLGIESYGVSMTSLEEVFLKLEESEAKTNAAYTGETSDDVMNDSSTIPLQNPANGIQNGRSNLQSIDTILSETRIIREDKPLLKHRLKALLKIRFLLATRNAIAVYFRLFMPIMYISLGIVLGKVLVNNNVPVSRSSEISSFQQPPLAFINSTGHDLSNFLQPMRIDYKISEVNSEQEIFNLSQKWAMDVFSMESETSGQVVSSNLTLYYNDTVQYSIPVGLRAILGSMYDGVGSVSILSDMTITTYPLPPLTKSSATDFGSFTLVQFIGMAFCLIPVGFLVEAVRDRQCKAKSQLRVFGISPSLYWGSIFLSDYLQYLIPAIVTIIAIAVAQVEALNNAGAIVAVVILLLLYMPNMMLMAYCFSFLFDKQETALMAAPNLFILAGYIPYLPVSLLDSTNPDVCRIIHYIMCVLDPPYTLFGGLHYTYRVYRQATKDLITGNANIEFGEYFQWSSHIPIAMLMMVLFIPLLMLFMRYLDLKSTGGDTQDLLHCNKHLLNSSVGPNTNEDLIKNEDSDVAAERQKVASIDSSKPVIIVDGLRKEFVDAQASTGCCKKDSKSESNKLAVRNNSFVVMPGEVLGLLGPNGAGKTTTLNMIIAEVAPSCGKVTVGGLEVRSSLSKAFQLMGYCPQHDPLWETITLKEHLTCFAAIKGVVLDDIHLIEDYFLKNLEIEEHKNKKAKELSGGTKRKLSYILSMLGDLKIVLLDEPSTGMDPKAKRFLWDTISASFKSERRGAILTTHYMEEADALCSRIAIMVNGEMKCLGSSTHLKTKYGSGYTLEVKLKLSDTELEERHTELDTKIKELFVDATLNERFGERAIYKVPRNSSLSLAEAFIALEDMKRSMGVEEYSFSQATLEQVFLDFAKKQVDELDDIDAKKVKEGNEHVPATQPTFTKLEDV